VDTDAARNSAGVGRSFDHFHAAYEDALNQGISVSGESQLYFARGRIAFLARCLRRASAGLDPVLDFGCGTGVSAPLFQELLGARQVTGVDVSALSLEAARRAHGSEQVSFTELGAFQPAGQFGVAYCNGVFHHVPPAERLEVARLLFRALAPGGHLALWDNNPWNPGARYVMSRIPFDRDAVMLSSLEAARLLRQAGFAVARTDYLFIFPRLLRALRWLEPRLSRLPLGAQYQVLARKG
jgi:SAM-dependent methyltransferase